MRCTGMDSPHHERPAGVAERFQVREHPVSSESSEPRDVLSEDPIGSQFGHDPSHFVPQAGTLSVEAGALAGNADVLAREASGDEINSPDSGGSKSIG